MNTPNLNAATRYDRLTMSLHWLNEPVEHRP